MSEIVGKVQVRLKRSSADVFNFVLKVVSGLVLALTIALIVQEVLGINEGDGRLSFTFMLVVFTALFIRLSKKWTLTTVLVFDLCAVLVGIILRLYIMVAPGA